MDIEPGRKPVIEAEPFVLSAPWFYAGLCLASLIFATWATYTMYPYPTLSATQRQVHLVLGLISFGAIPGFVFGVWRAYQRLFSTPTNRPVRVASAVFVVMALWKVMITPDVWL